MAEARLLTDPGCLGPKHVMKYDTVVLERTTILMMHDDSGVGAAVVRSTEFIRIPANNRRLAFNLDLCLSARPHAYHVSFLFINYKYFSIFEREIF